MRLEIRNVQLIGEELAVQWNDGEESYFPSSGSAGRARAPRVGASRMFWAISRGRM